MKSWGPRTYLCDPDCGVLIGSPSASGWLRPHVVVTYPGRRRQLGLQGLTGSAQTPLASPGQEPETVREGPEGHSAPQRRYQARMGGLRGPGLGWEGLAVLGWVSTGSQHEVLISGHPCMTRTQTNIFLLHTLPSFLPSPSHSPSLLPLLLAFPLHCPESPYLPRPYLQPFPMPQDLTLCPFALQDATAEPVLAEPGACSSLPVAVPTPGWGLLPPGLHPGPGLHCL